MKGINVGQLDTVTSKYLYPQGSPQRRLFALWYFGSLITLWNIAGHTFLGFEQSWASPVVSVGTAALVTLLLEHLRSFTQNDQVRYLGGTNAFASTFIPALIPGLAVGMLLYPNESLLPLVFASALSIASKVLIRIPFGNGTQHIFNPSNLGITLTLFLFPSVGLAPPYHFTENLTGAAHWLLPLGILLSGLFVHGYATGRLPLCAAWIGGFVLQGLIRSWIFDIPWNVPLMPMTSAAFILFTLYMIPDPATTPLQIRRQIAFGLTVAAIYGVVISAHIVFGLFVALFATSALRGAALAASTLGGLRDPHLTKTSQDSGRLTNPS
ncbi:enediyne biosynthesis protein UnbU [Hydrogenophaga luteola]|uniref:Enediyne biosynthesis protein UnbU n=1 Tax=Hydrogenophaga luteola TaxID=1591122 RepID=A0ABV7WC79_9BURK